MVWRPVPVAAACAALAGCAHPPPVPPVELVAAGDGSGCRFEAEGRALTGETLAEAALGWRGRPVHLDAGIEVPYKCFGLAIYTLQGAGVKHIGFISEPPPEPR